MRKYFAGLTLLMAAVALPSCSPSDVNVNRLLSAGVQATQAMTLSDDQVVEYVKQYVDYLDSNSKVLPAGNAYSKRLANLTRNFTSVDGMPLNFKVYKTDEINAFACADGSVRVYTGIMDAMTDDELRGVIGHEIGHVAHKDSKNAFKQALLTSALREGLASTSGTIAALTDSQLGDLGEAMLSAKYSRKQETAADNYAFDFLKEKGYNPWSLALAFEKMSQMENSGSQSSALLQLFSSHPDTQKRIDNIKKRCREEGIAPPAGVR